MTAAAELAGLVDAGVSDPRLGCGIRVDLRCSVDAWVPAGRRSGGVVMWAYERAAYITER